MLFTVKSEMKSLVYLNQGFLLSGNEKIARRLWKMTGMKRRILWSAVLAIATVFFLTSETTLAFPLLMDPASAFCLPVTAGIAFLYLKAFFPFEKRRFILSLISGFLMGLMFILGIRYSLNEIPAPTAFGFLTALSAATLLFSAFTGIFLRMIPFVSKTVGEGGKKPGIKPLALLFLITFAVYMTALLAVYPGVYSYDASVQILQVFGSDPLTSHHPVLHTLFLCGSLKIGEVFFHSYQIGLALYSLIQITMMAAVFSFVLYRMMRRNAPLWLVLASWLFLAANPYMQVLVLLTTKDVLFSAFFLLAFDFSIDMISDPEHFFKSRALMASFFLSALFSCFFRNQGIYVFLFFSLFALLFFIRYKKQHGGARPLASRWLIFSVALAAVYLTVNGPVFTSLGVEKGDAKEMLSVPMQQLARVWHEKPESLSKEERAYIEALILPDALEGYVRVNADPVKSGFQTGIVKKDPGMFLKTWAAIGAKEPLVYLDSFLMGNWGYWYPGDTQYWIDYIVFDGSFMEEEYNILHIFRNSRFPQYENYLRSISLTPEYENIPLLALILNQAFPFWLMLLTGTALVYRRQAALLVPLSMIFGYFGTLLLGPVTCVRYALPLIVCVPLMAEILLYRTRERIVKE